MINIALVQILIQSIMALFPGVSTGVTQFVGSITQMLPTLIVTGTDIVTFVQTHMDLVKTMVAEHRDPTADEWNALNLAVGEELAKLNAGSAAAAPAPP